ncbi:MAG: hypothetical protein ACI9QN_000370 [Arcticibacterium sp.]|jgi:hypothetical protein
MDGLAGKFNISVSTKSGFDNRAKEKLAFVGIRYLLIARNRKIVLESRCLSTRKHAALSRF